MRFHRSVRVAIIACTVVITGAGAAAPIQSPERPTYEKTQDAAGGHKHYIAPERDLPNQRGELAPRLQNVGKYVFPVSTKNAKAPLFIN